MLTRNQNSKLFDLSHAHQKTHLWRFYLTKRQRKFFGYVQHSQPIPQNLYVEKIRHVVDVWLKKRTSTSYLFLSSWQKKYCTCSTSCLQQFFLLAQNGLRIFIPPPELLTFFLLASHRVILVVPLCKKSFFPLHNNGAIFLLLQTKFFGL